MTWNMPRLPPKPSEGGPPAAEPPPPPPAGDQEKEAPVQVRTGWLSVMQVAGLFVPSPWLFLTIGLYGGLRLVGLGATGVLDAESIWSWGAMWGVFADATILFAMFAAVRLWTATVSRDRDPRHPSSRLAARVLFLMFLMASLIRCADVIYSAIEKVPIGEAFWVTVFEHPGVLFAQGAAIGVVVVALIIAVVARYSLSADLESVQDLTYGLPRTASYLWSVAAAASSAIVALAVIVGAATTPEAVTGGSRLPEVHVLQALREALARPELALPPATTLEADPTKPGG